MHDVQPSLFRLFLEALYSGQLDTAGLTTEQLVEMVTLCDRYEVSDLCLVLSPSERVCVCVCVCVSQCKYVYIMFACVCVSVSACVHVSV